MLALALLLPASVLLGLATGAVPLSLAQTVAGLWQFFIDAIGVGGVNGIGVGSGINEASGVSGTNGTGNINNIGDTINNQAALIVGHIRLPRVLLAALVGGILACCGAAMQGLFRNPLADPSLIGVTAGASLGASVMIVLGAGAVAGYAGLTLVSGGAFVGGLLAVLLVYRLATSASGTSVSTMLLAGIAITALAGSLGSLLDALVDNAMLRQISLWRMGALDGADYPRLLVGAVVAGVLLLILPRYARALNILLLGESEARHLGLNVPRVKFGLVGCVAVGVGCALALAGTIAFVGLMVPHIMRMLTGPDHRRLLPACALGGAVLLVLADTAARRVLAPAELPVGVVTALVGVPFFIFLLRRREHYELR